MNRTVVKRSADHKVQAFDWGTLTWFASQEIGNSETMTLGRCVIKPGCENPRHSHPNCDEILHVLQGQILHAIENGESVRMATGDTISIPPNIVHNAKNLAKQDAILVICFSSAERKTKGE